MKKVEHEVSVSFARPLLNVESGDLGSPRTSQCVAIHHGHIDSLVGRLMQMCDLIGDVSQRKALKDTIKQITRSWMDNQYEESGSSKWAEIQRGARLVTIAASDGEIQDGKTSGACNPWGSIMKAE